MQLRAASHLSELSHCLAPAVHRRGPCSHPVTRESVRAAGRLLGQGERRGDRADWVNQSPVTPGEPVTLIRRPPGGVYVTDRPDDVTGPGEPGIE